MHRSATGRSRRATTACAIVLAALASGAPALAADESVVADAAGLADLSLEQLRDVVVTTVSRSEERLDLVAASVYVISADDIRRSGATTITEALRLAPTLDVARADANQYAISARGFNNVLANKMLVMIDGRTVYTPLFSGVFWEAQDVMLEDVERIEVVTGPSTALWGSNAVNGLIHVITRPARLTQGAAAAAHAGNQERGAAVRYGGALGESGRFRIYAKSYDRSASQRADGGSVADASNGVQTGFRADWTPGRDAFTLQGDAYRGSIGEGTAVRDFSGANALARWQRNLAGGAVASVQVFLDHTERSQPPQFAERLDTIDANAQYSFSPSAGQHVVVGGGWRHSRDHVGDFAALAFVPATRSLAWRRVFAQDRIDLTSTLALTLSGSVEGNPYTGYETLPSVRLAWVAAPSHTLWASLSRAARAPSRVDRDFFVPAQPPYAVAGGSDFRSEISDVLELGYRAQPTPSLSYAATLFQAEHRRLRSLGPSAQGLQFQNNIEGRSRGLEAWGRWRVLDNWRLDAGLVMQNQSLQVIAGAVDLGGLASLGNDPRRHKSLRSSLDLGRVHWDIGARRVSARPNPVVPAYTAVDSRLAWQLARSTEVAIGVQNLFDPSHAEWGVAANRVELQRAFFVQLRFVP